MSILIIGSNGSMGKRYQAILKHLKKDFSCSDIDTNEGELNDLIDMASGVIIATPTSTHLHCLERVAALKIPIMCEKPLSKDLSELEKIRQLFPNGNLTMTMQYKMLDDPSSEGETHYNYFRHGSDGLNWDCIQLIGLARQKVYLDETSPVWQCVLNGKKLSLSDMDVAYVQFVLNWIERPGDDINRLIDIHHKVIEL